MGGNKTHTMKQDADLVRGNKVSQDVGLHQELHPDSRKPGKGEKASKQFSENCDFNLDHTK